MDHQNLRNIAIIAHVDHGKTTLVDELFKQSGIYRANQQTVDRVMDSNALERERGITILAKNTAVMYGDTKINIVDTPGHADFGGEVERILKMVNGVLLLVDAFEGPMPQTRFVLSRALELGHKVIVVINKTDRPDARVDEVIDEVLELLMELDATGEQLDAPIIYASGRNGTASTDPHQLGTDFRPLFDMIVNYFDPPETNTEAPFQMLVSAIDYNDYVGRIAVGRLERGIVKKGQDIVLTTYGTTDAVKAKAIYLYEFDGLNKKPVEEAYAGDIVCLAGIENVNIGDTICDPSCLEPLPFVKISEPTVEMEFSVNDSPFAGRSGKYVTSRNLRDRLYRELLKDVSLRVRETDSTDAFMVMGRGEMHLSILIETMRREGYEFQVGPPKVLFKDIDGVKCEPVERVIIDVPTESMGTVMESMGRRKGELVKMNQMISRVRLEYTIPARGLFGYRNDFMTETRGEGIMNSVFDSYQPAKGTITRRANGSLIAFETGEAVSYGLYGAQERGILFIDPGTPVYEGMVVGMSPKPEDLAVNVCKKKHITNMRASGSDEALRLTPPRKMSLEQSMEFLADDELLEITPDAIRIRKAILDRATRLRMASQKKAMEGNK
ncbi:MAG: translational GTPase TypA [Ruminococcaceae bacterium]|nr:translational GTPase TypA [Oscillospiraceae bacterium]